MASNWKNLNEIFQNHYPDNEPLAKIDDRIRYLQEAYEFTEKLWEGNFKSISDLKVVLLSEAPLYGEKKSYIYNPATHPTPFLHFNDIVAMSDDPQNLSHKFKSPLDKKKFMIETMAKNGFLVLDIFPYALNKWDTGITYRKIPKKKYNDLLSASIPFHLGPKLQQIAKISSSRTKFVYRYKVLQTNTSELVLNQMRRYGLDPTCDNIPCIGGENMSLSREKLSALYL